jgi:hypothetical protein
MSNWDDRNRQESAFDPNSVNAMFATLMERHRRYDLDMEADKEATAVFRAELRGELQTIKEQVLKTNGRVTALERFQQSVMVRVATLTAVIGSIGGFISWAVSIGLHHVILGK